MKRWFLILILSSLTFAQTKINPSQIRAPSGTASVAQLLSCTPSSTCVFAQPGIVPNAQTGTTYTVLATDRMKYVTFSNAAAIAVTLPQAGTSGFASNYVFVACDIGAGTATITPTTSTISSSNGSAYTAAAASLALTIGQCAWVYSDNTNYFAIVRAGSSGGGVFLYQARLYGGFGGTSNFVIYGDCGQSNGCESNNKTQAGAAGTAAALYVTLTSALAGTDTLSFTVFKNGSATSVTCTVPNSVAICNDTGHTFTFVAGDTLGYQSVCTGAGLCSGIALAYVSLKITGGS